MPERFEFEVIFALPEGEHDAFALSDTVFEAGYPDAVVGTGNARLLAVALEDDGDDAATVILRAARAIIAHLPPGAELREVRPDLVSLAEVAEKLKVKRQALQQREMPPPVGVGLYRIDEMREALLAAVQPKPGRRRARFDLPAADKWFKAGIAARRLNAELTLRRLDPVTIQAVAPAADPDR
ncbi:hypothetical protein [Caenispirillum bisanense]|uniref:DNA-binding protein n=1 Tax=Caenispirillum bisanense TaxID=414052 RepID=A0A286GYB9_9PROT|nr:hypothetical protein [Caenispirillum bisanense]SOE00089.1 hypothetical protein SAMN05421508_11176 [Caenispirillum bisanense]